MLDAAIRRSLALPRGWPARVRSSTVHAISLAHLALTYARGIAGNSINHRMRYRQAETGGGALSPLPGIGNQPPRVTRQKTGQQLVLACCDEQHRRVLI